MKRQVLYNKKAHTEVAPFPKKEKKETTSKPRAEEKAVNHSSMVIEWLESHELIKIRPLCEKAGIDAGNFHRWMNVSKEIPDHAIEKITPILKDYGFKAGV